MDLNVTYVTCCENGLFGLKRLVSATKWIKSVITITPDVAKRANVSGYTDVRPFCEAHSIPCVQLDRYQVVAEDISSDSNVLIVNGWNRLIKSDVLSRFKLGGFGIHAGHPPIGLGRAPLPWNLIKGHKNIDVYVFQLTANADDGDIVAIQRVEITPFDQVQSLYEKVMYVGALLFEKTLHDLAENKLEALRQNLEDKILYPKRAPEDGEIDFFDSVERIYDFIRAQSHPYPGAYTWLGKDKWTVWKAIPFDAYFSPTEQRLPGKILTALPSGLVVQTGTTPIWLQKVVSRKDYIVPQPLDKLNRWVGLRLGRVDRAMQRAGESQHDLPHNKI